MFITSQKLHQLFGVKYCNFKYGYHLTVMRKNETKLVLDTVIDIAQLSLLEIIRGLITQGTGTVQSMRENIGLNCDFYEVRE